MSSIQTIIDTVTSHPTVRLSVSETIRSFVLQLEDAVNGMAADAGFGLHQLLDDLKRKEAALVTAILRHTPADDHKETERMPVPVPNPMNPTTVGETVVTADLSRVADAGHVQFTAPNGVVANFPQVDKETGQPAVEKAP